MRSLVDRWLVCAYVAIAVLPIAAMTLGWPDHKLWGALEPQPRPALSFQAFRHEELQPKLAAWFESSLGFRNWAVFLDNTVLYHAFGETKPLAHVVVGKHGVLFERDDISFYTKPAAELPTPERIAALADAVADLQRRLAARHEAFVPVIVPSKTTVYRDAVPDRYDRDVGEPRPSDLVYPELVRALDARGVLYVDARKRLLARDVPRTQLWAPEGRHWSLYGACLVMADIVARYRELTGRGLDYDCQKQLTDRLPRSHDDYDLLRLVNAWRVPRSHEPHAIALHAPSPPGDKPSLMLISSSFGWQLRYDLETSDRFSTAFLDYYDRTLYQWPENIEEPVEPNTPAWRAAFLGRDLYVYELFETYLLADDRFMRVLDKLRSSIGPD